MLSLNSFKNPVIELSRFFRFITWLWCTSRGTLMAALTSYSSVRACTYTRTDTSLGARKRSRWKSSDRFRPTEISYCDTSAEALLMYRVKPNAGDFNAKHCRRCTLKSTRFRGDSSNAVPWQTITMRRVRNRLSLVSIERQEQWKPTVDKEKRGRRGSVNFLDKRTRFMEICTGFWF